MRIQVFNPGYESSAELGDVHYTAPKMVREMRSDLATLPIYWADESDQILVKDSKLTELNPRFSTTLCHNNVQIVPWGWAPELKQLFPNVTLPYSAQEMRHWASRRRSIELNRLICNQTPGLFKDYPPISLSELREKASKYQVLKDEFASSGRGIQYFPDGIGIEEAIKSRKGNNPDKELFLEHYYPVLQDRGYEFIKLPDGSVRYLGLSLFETDRGRYIGNHLAPAHLIEEKAEHLPTIPTHSEYIDLLIQAIGKLDLGSYTGYLGVDTGVYRDREGLLRLIPCFEINVRPTMGHLALKLSERYLRDSMRGVYSIKQIHPKAPPIDFVTPTPLWAQSTDIPPTIPGTYPLTPLLPDTRFVATLTLLE